jgi:hypothetical protein
MSNEEEIVPESPRHDEQPMEHVKSLHPEAPADPKPIIPDEGAVPVPAGPIV